MAAKKKGTKPAKAKAKVKAKAKAPVSKKKAPAAKRPVRKPAPKPKPKPKVKPKAKSAPKAKVRSKPVVKAAKPAKPVARKVEVKAEKNLKVNKVVPPVKAVAVVADKKATAAVKTAVKPAEAPAAKTAPAPTPAKGRGKSTEPKAPVVAVMTNVDPLSGPVRTLKKALKERFLVEVYIHSTPFALYEMISTPSGLSKWFCDDVNVRGEEFTFIWGLDQQTAEVLSRKQGELIRMHWKEDDDEGSFFELRIRIDPLTNEVALVVTDHAWPAELQEARQLWESQVHTLQRALGA